MASRANDRVEANVRYGKKWVVLDDWGVGPRHGSAGKFKGSDIHIQTGVPHEIVFHVNCGNHKLEWDDEPIWVSRRSCPKSSESDPQITIVSVDRPIGTLTIRDSAAEGGRLYYSLNFRKTNGSGKVKSKRFDPIIIHGHH